MSQSSWWCFFNKILLISLFIVWCVLIKISISIKNNLCYIVVLGLIILLFFQTIYIWKFYLLFEISIIPILIIIIGYGSNIIRIRACYYILIYIIIFSFPLLRIIIINLSLNFNLLIENWNLNIFRSIILIIPVIVKCPVFGVHLWLPKAHVEASTIGSIILARGLLKLGTIGLFKLLIWNINVLLNNFLVIGIVARSFLCLLQTDFKKLVAYRSVAHITIRVYRVVNSNIGFLSFVLINRVHTFISSYMFYMSGYLRSLNKTRIIIILSSRLLTQYVVFISLIINLGIPPRFSFISEFFILRRFFIKNFLNLIILIFFVIRSLIYTVLVLNYINFSCILSKIFTFKTIEIIFLHIIFILMWFLY